MAPRQRTSKGANVPTAASEPVGENEVAFRQRNEVPLVEQEVVSGQRRPRQEPDLVARMVEMLKDLQQEIASSKRIGPKKLGITSPLWSTRTGPNQREGQQ